MRPGPSASRSAWLEFYRQSAAVYRWVAEHDSSHRDHALHWANREQTKADELSAQPDKPARPSRATSAGKMPATLEQAHDALKAAQPPEGASARRWLAYHQHAEAVYAEVAEVDRRHHHEALVWAACEREKAAKLAQAVQETCRQVC